MDYERNTKKRKSNPLISINSHMIGWRVPAIEEINAAYNTSLDVDVASKSALQMRDLLLKNGHLRDSARNNSLRDFRFAYFDAVQDALLEGFEQNQEFYTLLLDNDEKKRELMQVFLEDVYRLSLIHI